MTVISAPLPWVEAQDPPCKGEEENQKGATKSLLSDFRTQKPQENDTTALRNKPVIYFRQTGPTHIYQTQKKHKNNTHTTASGKKSQARSNQREAWVGSTTRRPVAACLTNSRRRKAKGLAPDLRYKEHEKPLTGTTTTDHNNKIKQTQNHHRKLPTWHVVHASSHPSRTSTY